MGSKAREVKIALKIPTFNTKGKKGKNNITMQQ